MESLSPECTPLKHRYDSCFNAWFEGYLQPALDASSSSSSSSSSVSATSTSSQPSLTASSSSSSSSSITSTTLSPTHTPQDQQQNARKPLITSWATAFPSRRSSKAVQDVSSNTSGVEQHEHHWYDFALSEPEPESSTQAQLQTKLEQIDTKGKTRSQIKAEEYQRNCGKFWEDYQGCLKNAISQNESLSGLLETAREEHPLGSLDGLKGTPWDSKADFTKDQE
ncbi:uncharacterized protein L201_001956 [Kwoniella dendrophila CBS 6074]|uniref:Uncharacterized protein n=1 Tax=Kwoniella dendrophila CBS 6074 TaxID=1295534 RepID=A0AAX4JNT0_9TREE